MAGAQERVQVIQDPREEPDGRLARHCGHCRQIWRRRQSAKQAVTAPHVREVTYRQMTRRYRDFATEGERHAADRGRRVPVTLVRSSKNRFCNPGPAGVFETSLVAEEPKTRRAVARRVVPLRHFLYGIVALHLPHGICSGFDLPALPELRTRFRTPFSSLHPRVLFSFSPQFAFRILLALPI
jgi:hypothetical protein